MIYDNYEQANFETEKERFAKSREVVKHNTQTILGKKDNEIYYVDKNDKLYTLPKSNWWGRLVLWYKGASSNAKIANAAMRSLEANKGAHLREFHEIWVEKDKKIPSYLKDLSIVGHSKDTHQIRGFDDYNKYG